MAFKRVIIRRVGPLSWLLGDKGTFVQRILLIIMTMLFSSPVAASDYTGMFALVIGLPAILVGIVLSLLFSSSSSKTLKSYGGIIISVCLLVDIVVAKGAADLDLSRLGIFVFIYIALCMLLLYLQYKLVKKIPSQAESNDNSQNVP